MAGFGASANRRIEVADQGAAAEILDVDSADCPGREGADVRAFVGGRVEEDRVGWIDGSGAGSSDDVG